MISSLTLRNFGPYRGEHRLDLSPTIYAVVARREDDPDASNFNGKSWLLSAIRFALFGSHLADREDDWITRGEREGGVAMSLAGGMTIERSRELGKSTQIVVGGARGKDAQQLVERAVGLGEGDFLAASFFEQKKMARFVSARSSERSEEVSAWLRLDRIERARSRVVVKARDLSQAEDRLVGCKVALYDRMVKLRVPTAEELNALRSTVEKYASAIHEKEAELEQVRNLLASVDAARRREKLEAEIAALEAEGDVEPDVEGPALRHHQALRVHQNAFRDAVAKRVLARGQFDGACPVNGRSCPVADELNADRARNSAMAVDADVVARMAHEDVRARAAELDAAQGALGALREHRARLKAFREQCDALGPPAPAQSPGGPIPNEALVWELERAVRELREGERAAVSDLDRAERARAELDELTREVAQVEEEGERAAAVLRTHREALAVLGRNGVQRRLAEGALREVEEGANALLSEAGIDLEVGMVWDRPTNNPAEACEVCDIPFPRSRAVKECQRCGVARGKKLAHGLDVELSKRSGFAEDAAGIALSLAASAWLRRERDVQWPVLCADEPFSAADARNRRALLNLFRIAAGRCGLRQMFLVAHSDAVMDGLPGRIQIVAGPSGSRVSVV